MNTTRPSKDNVDKEKEEQKPSEPSFAEKRPKIGSGDSTTSKLITFFKPRLVASSSISQIEKNRIKQEDIIRKNEELQKKAADQRASIPEPVVEPVAVAPLAASASSASPPAVKDPNYLSLKRYLKSISEIAINMVPLCSKENKTDIDIYSLSYGFVLMGQIIKDASKNCHGYDDNIAKISSNHNFQKYLTLLLMTIRNPVDQLLVFLTPKEEKGHPALPVLRENLSEDHSKEKGSKL